MGNGERFPFKLIFRCRSVFGNLSRFDIWVQIKLFNILILIGFYGLSLRSLFLTPPLSLPLSTVPPSPAPARWPLKINGWIKLSDNFFRWTRYRTAFPQRLIARHEQRFQSTGPPAPHLHDIPRNSLQFFHPSTLWTEKKFLFNLVCLRYNKNG